MTRLKLTPSLQLSRCLTIAVFILVLLSAWIESSLAARPFWTQKSSYVEGEFLYVVGHVSKMASLPEAKQQALVHGKLELMNAAQISEVGAKSLTLETRHTYVEQNTDGSVNVYQLLRIPASNVLEAQARLQTQRQAQATKLEASQQQLSIIRKVLLTRQQTIDEQTASLEELIERISKKQQDYAKKTQEIDRQQAAMAQLEKKLETTFVSIDEQMNQVDALLQQYQSKGQAQATKLGNLKTVEENLQDNETEVQRIQQAILARMKKTENRACEYVSQGMSPEDVKQLLGKPAGEKHSYANERYDTWAYGTTKVNFDSQGVVGSISGCPKKKPTLSQDLPKN